MTRIDLPLSNLTYAQKLDLMERLWTDLSAEDAKFESPAWHGSVLAARRQAVEEGRAKFTEWSEAKERLRKEFP